MHAASDGPEAPEHRALPRVLHARQQAVYRHGLLLRRRSVLHHGKAQGSADAGGYGDGLAGADVPGAQARARPQDPAQVGEGGRGGEGGGTRGEEDGLGHTAQRHKW